MKVSWSAAFLAALAGSALAAPAETPAQNGEAKRDVAHGAKGIVSLKLVQEKLGTGGQSTHRLATLGRQERRAVSEQQAGHSADGLVPDLLGGVGTLLTGLLGSSKGAKKSSPSPSPSPSPSARAYGKPSKLPGSPTAPSSKPYVPLSTAALSRTSTYGGPRKAYTTKAALASPTAPASRPYAQKSATSKPYAVPTAPSVKPYKYGGPRKSYAPKPYGFTAPHMAMMPTASPAKPYGGKPSTSSANLYNDDDIPKTSSAKPYGATPTTSSAKPYGKTPTPTTSSAQPSSPAADKPKPTSSYGNAGDYRRSN